MKDRLVALAKGAAHRADVFQERHLALAFPWAILKKFTDDRAHNLAALVAYYAFFSFMPLLLVLYAILGLVAADFPNAEQAIKDSVLNQFPLQLHFNFDQKNGLALAIGIVVALWAGLRVANAAQNAMNAVWDVPVKKRPNIAVRTVRSLSIVGLLGAGVIATTVVASISTSGASYGLAISGTLRIVAALVALAANTALFTIGFRMLTTRDVPTRALLPGAFMAAICWQLVQLLGSYYIAHTVKGAQETYGTFATVIGLLTWFFLVAQLTLLSAELNVVLRARLWPRALFGDPRTDADRRAIERQVAEFAAEMSKGEDAAANTQETPKPKESSPDR